MNFTLQKSYTYSLALMVFIQTVLPKFILFGFIALGLTVIVGSVKKQFTFKWNSILMLFATLYIAYIIGVFFTNNLPEAKVYAENKLSFLLFPILFSFAPKFKIELKQPFISLIVGVIVTSIIGGVKVLTCNSGTLEIPCISHFSSVHHPTYFAAYIIVSIVVMFYGYKKKWKGFYLWTVILYSVFATAICALTMSTSGLLFYILLLIAFIIIWFKNILGLRITFYCVASVLVLAILFVVFTDLRQDFYYTSQSIITYLKGPHQFLEQGNRYLIGNEVRLIMWTVTIVLISKHPFGVGTGNTDQYITDELLHYDLVTLAQAHYNPHNQFLQTWLEIGIVGFALLVGIVILGIQLGIKNKNYLLVIVCSSLAFNSLFESMLQRQSGIVFYTFWICLLYCYSQWTTTNSSDK